MPSSRIASISRAMSARASRYSGMPSTIIPPRRSLGLVDGDRVTGEPQVVRGREPGGPAADHADRRAVGGRDRRRAPRATPRSRAKLSTPKRSVTNRLSARIAIGASTVPRRHAVSHGAAHTRPQIDANGLGARAIRYASAIATLGDRGHVRARRRCAPGTRRGTARSPRASARRGSGLGHGAGIRSHDGPGAGAGPTRAPTKIATKPIVATADATVAGEPGQVHEHPVRAEHEEHRADDQDRDGRQCGPTPADRRRRLLLLDRMLDLRLRSRSRDRERRAHPELVVLGDVADEHVLARLELERHRLRLALADVADLADRLRLADPVLRHRDLVVRAPWSSARPSRG